MIDGVMVVPLRKIPDERGAILQMLKATDPHFRQFGEIYFSLVYPGVIKGWHVHSRMTLNYAVPIGMIKLVLYDARNGSGSKGRIMEIFTGELDYRLVSVPPGVVNGFKGIGITPALVANCATHPHDPTGAEMTRIPPFDNDIPYDWSLKHQ